MKKFITILSALILMSISYTANAQFVDYLKQKQTKSYTVQVQEPSVDSMTGPEFLKSAVYQDALKLSNSGRKQFFTGITLSLAGAAAVGIGVPLSYDYDFGYVLTIFGGLSAITGTVLEITGGSKWAKGDARLRNLRFEYAIRADRIVISF